MKKYNLHSIMPFVIAMFLEGVTIGSIFPILYSLIVASNSTLIAATYDAAQREFYYNAAVFIYMLSWAWGSAFFSALSDKIGRKPTLIIALLGRLLALGMTILSVLLGSLTWLFVGRLLSGITNGTQPVAEAVAVDICPSKHRRTAFISYMLLPIGIGDLLGNFLVNYFSKFSAVAVNSTIAPLWTLIISTLLGLLLFIFAFKETFPGDKTLKIGLTYPITLFKRMQRPIFIFSILFLFSVTAWSLFYVYLSDYAAQHFQLSSSYIDFTLAIPAAGLIVAWGFLTQLLHRRFSSIPIFIACKSLLIFSILLILSQSTLYFFWILVAIISICSGVAYVTLLGIYANLVNELRQGWVMGISSGFHLLAFALATLIATGLLNIPLSALYLVACGFALISISMAWYFRSSFNL